MHAEHLVREFIVRTHPHTHTNTSRIFAELESFPFFALTVWPCLPEASKREGKRWKPSEAWQTLVDKEASSSVDLESECAAEKEGAKSRGGLGSSSWSRGPVSLERSWVGV